MNLKSKKSRKEPPKSPDINKAATSSSSILRKPVLQLSTFGNFGSSQDRDSSAIKSPFSLNLNSPSRTNSSSIFTTSLVCNVCDSITKPSRPRKYGAVCCLLCKKFMSKTIKKVNKPPVVSLHCDKGDGWLLASWSNLSNC